jgi:prevent-host-death family protein
MLKTVTMLELRQNADKIVQQVMSGQRLVLTYRGKPVMRLEPIVADRISEDDPAYGLTSIADQDAGSVTNEEIDGTLYGE